MDIESIPQSSFSIYKSPNPNLQNSSFSQIKIPIEKIDENPLNSTQEILTTSMSEGMKTFALRYGIPVRKSMNENKLSRNNTNANTLFIGGRDT
jgi:hypothetical protein